MVGWAHAKVNEKRLKVDIGYVRKRPREKAFRLAIEAAVEARAIFTGLNSGGWELNFITRC